MRKFIYRNNVYIMLATSLLGVATGFAWLVAKFFTLPPLPPEWYVVGLGVAAIVFLGWTVVGWILEWYWFGRGDK